MHATLIKISESTWSIPIAALLLVAMFAAFYTVVSDATQAGEQRRRATATQTAAMAHCKPSKNWTANTGCNTAIALPLGAESMVTLASR